MKPALAVLASVAALCVACGSPTPTATDESETVSPDTATVEPSPPAVPVDAPVVISLPLDFAASKNGVTLSATDVGQHIVDGVDHERGVYDRGNWRVVAQCDQMIGTNLNVGVIKADEFTAISAAGQGSSIADNTFQMLLDCP